MTAREIPDPGELREWLGGFVENLKGRGMQLSGHCPRCGGRDDFSFHLGKGAAQCFRCGESWGIKALAEACGVDLPPSWRDGGENLLPSPQARATVAAKLEADEATARRQAEGKARRRWEKASPATADHGYLSRKNISPEGFRREGVLLLVPLVEGSGEIRGLQTIDGSGEKRYPAHTKKTGHFWPGVHGFDALKDAETIAVSEGCATAASVTALSGLPCVAAMDAGNLYHVALELRRSFPQARFVFAADNDAKEGTPANPGIDGARKAAEAVGGLVVAPAVPGDWNDVATLEGIERAADIFAEAMEQAERPPVEEEPAPEPEAEDAPPLWDDFDGGPTPSPEDLYDDDGEEEDGGPMASSKTGRLSDLGNAQRLARLHGQRVRHVPELGWLYHNGVEWSTVDEARIVALSRDIPKLILREAAKEHDSKRRKHVTSWALASESFSKIRAAVALLRSEPGILSQPEDFDRDPFLLNVKNGTLDLRTGNLRPHAPGDMITMTAGTDYTPGARCPRWESFLQEIMGGDAELIEYLQSFAGYCLTGDVSAQVFLYCSGVGANGKSTFVETLAGVLGGYATALSPSALVAKQNDNTNELAGLRGCRLCHCAEMEGGRTLDAGLLKALSGGDSFRVRFLFKEFFTFRPSLKLVYCANSPPKVKDTSYGFWRRCRHVPFSVTIPPGRRDGRLREKLMEEAPGILLWCLEGLRRWQAEGLREPEAVASATRDYKDAENAVKQFCDETFQPIRGHTVLLARAHEKYLAWAKASGERTLGRNSFSGELRTLGYSFIRQSVGMAITDTAFLE